jgi:tetratricopeptide (TPR) repeat protein
MKKPLFILLAFWLHLNAFSQQDSLSSKDTTVFAYKIKNELIPFWEETLNMIADKNNGPDDVEVLIKNKTAGNANQRLFFNDKVTIESDLDPGAYLNQNLRLDLDVVQYLNTFNAQYQKSEEPTVAIKVVQLSRLKFNTYLYYNVLVEYHFTGINSRGKTYTPFNRILEVRVEKYPERTTMISGIRFPTGGEMDESRLFTKIITTDDDVEKALQRSVLEETRKTDRLKGEGDDFKIKKEYENALKKYREALIIQPANQEIKKLVNEMQTLAEKQVRDTENAEKKRKRIVELRAEALKAEENYNFKLAKILCDSLLNDYQDTDPAIGKLNSNLSQINAALLGIESAVAKKEYKEAKKTCEAKIKDNAYSDFYKAEFYFRLANILRDQDPEDSKILANLDKCISLSGRKHQEALKWRANWHLKNKNMITAVEDASQFINNDPRNPETYYFRADLYERDKNSKAAIEDYGKAISNKYASPEAHLRKAVLEYQSKDYQATFRTASAGAELFPTAGMLHFYKGIAKNMLERHKEAGNDFRTATKLFVVDSVKRYISGISKGYLDLGNKAFAAKTYPQSSIEFRKSIAIDSNQTALYMQARCFILKGANDSALILLNALLRMNNAFPDGLNQRGIALTNLKKFDLADKDLNNAIKQTGGLNSASIFSLGTLKLKQNKFAEAATFFERAGNLSPNDSTWFFAGYAQFMAGNNDQCIAFCQKAQKLNSERFEVYFYSGRAYFQKNQFKEAKMEFEKAFKYNTFDEGLNYWNAKNLMALKDFDDAAQNFEKLKIAPSYKLLAAFEAGVCWFKAGKPEFLDRAITNFKRYMELGDTIKDKSQAQAYTALCYLKKGTDAQAQSFISDATSANENSPMLLWVLACQNAAKGSYDLGLANLEKALNTGVFTLEDVSKEILLKELSKQAGFKELKKKYAK